MSVDKSNDKNANKNPNKSPAQAEAKKTAAKSTSKQQPAPAQAKAGSKKVQKKPVNSQQKNQKSAVTQKTVKSERVDKAAPSKNIEPKKDKSAAPKKLVAQQPNKTDAPSEQPPSPKSGRGMAGLALLCSLLALGAGGYAVYQTTLDEGVTGEQVSGLDDRLKLLVTDQQASQSGLDDRLKLLVTDQHEFQSSLDEVSAKTDKIGESISTDASRMDEALSALQGSIQTLQTNATVSIDEVKADLGESVARWKLDEVQSLLSRVNQSYLFTGDKVQAKAGLEYAQSTLASMEDSRIEKVKTALAEDFALLDANKAVDIAALNSRLMALSALVPSLKFVEDARREQASKVEAEPIIDAAPVDPEASGIISFGQTLLNDIGSMVKHKRLDAPLKPSLNDDLRFILNESLNLNLEAAMVAMQRRDNEAYQTQLQLANDKLTTRYDVEHAETKAMLSELASLKSEDISLQVNDISAALSALNQVMGN